MLASKAHARGQEISVLAASQASFLMLLGSLNVDLVCNAHMYASGEVCPYTPLVKLSHILGVPCFALLVQPISLWVVTSTNYRVVACFCMVLQVDVVSLLT